MTFRLGKHVPCLLVKVEIAAKTKRWPGVTLLTLAKVLKVAVNDIRLPLRYAYAYGCSHTRFCGRLRAVSGESKNPLTVSN